MRGASAYSKVDIDSSVHQDGYRTPQSLSNSYIEYSVCRMKRVSYNLFAPSKSANSVSWRPWTGPSDILQKSIRPITQLYMPLSNNFAKWLNCGLGESFGNPVWILNRSFFHNVATSLACIKRDGTQTICDGWHCSKQSWGERFSRVCRATGTERDFCDKELQTCTDIAFACLVISVLSVVLSTTLFNIL